MPLTTAFVALDGKNCTMCSRPNSQAVMAKTEERLDDPGDADADEQGGHLVRDEDADAEPDERPEPEHEQAQRQRAHDLGEGKRGRSTG